mmetsp:Transcript_3115/g.7000  ORF Transcript_3115/g.7000 Transcript_3115/m.7000 type:complete len:705 (-) Transcript_3115:58-2172(-)
MPVRKVAIDALSGGVRVLSSVGSIAVPKAASDAATSVAQSASSAASFVVGGIHPWNLPVNIEKFKKIVSDTKGLQDAAGTFAKQSSQVGSGVGSQFMHSGVEVANDIFAALGLRVWISLPAARTATAQVRVVESPSKSHVLTETIGARRLTEFVTAMQSDRSTDVEGLVDCMVADGRLSHVWFLPPAFQRKLYIDLAQVLIFGVKQSLLTLDDTSIWGHKLKVSTRPVLNVAGLATGRTSTVGEDQLRLVVDALLESRVVHLRGMPQALERQIYHNCVVVVVQLIENLLSADEQQIALMGHAMRFHLEPQPIHVVRDIMSELRVKRGEVDEEALEELVETFLEETNLAWVPDLVERQVYKAVFRLMIRVAEDLLCRLRMNVLGRELKLSLVSAVRGKVIAQSTGSGEEHPDVAVFLEEHQPLKTLSTTELEERLKDLDEQRRILKSLQRLHGADFDLTAEVPMRLLDGQPGDASTHAPAAASQQSGQAATAAAASGSEEVEHIFEQMTLTRKLARSLHLQCEVPTEISVPFEIIGDVATYPQWMPWCTSGRVLGPAMDDLKLQTFCESREQGAQVFTTEVGFGFETRTFLGTIEDVITYRLSKQVPVVLDSSSVQPPTSPPRGRVVADAIQGFSYADRLVYDWRFTYIDQRRTKVELDMFFEALSVLHIPIWDSLQRMIVDNMLSAFIERSKQIQQRQDAQKRS